MKSCSKSWFMPKNWSLPFWSVWFKVELVRWLNIAFSHNTVRRQFSNNDLWRNLAQIRVFTLKIISWKFQEDISILNWLALQKKFGCQTHLRFSKIQYRQSIFMVTPHKNLVKIMINAKKFCPAILMCMGDGWNRSIAHYCVFTLHSETAIF